jgi:hypothetical protein
MNEHQNLLSPERVTASVEAGIVTMSEPELTAAIEEVTARWGEELVRLDERAGNSPYSPQSILLLNSISPLERGDRFRLAALGKSYDGSGKYNSKGRWRKVWLARRIWAGQSGLDADNSNVLVRCHENDPNSQRVGCLNLWVQDVESWTKSESVGRTAVLSAFEKLGF